MLCIVQARIYAQDATTEDVCGLDGCCCKGEDPTPAGVMISHVHQKNEWMISYRFMGMNMGDLAQGISARGENDVLSTYAAYPDFMRMNMHMLMAMCGISDRLTVMTMFNYSSGYMEMTMPVGRNLHHHGMSSAGLGDTKLYALYALSKKPIEQILVSLGVNLPTGSIMNKGEPGAMMYPNQRLPYNMQLGSGTYDLLPGITYLSQKRKMTYSAQMTSVLRTNYSAIGYKLGNELDLNAWTGWQWLPFMSSTLRLEGTIAGKIKGKDQSLDIFVEPSANSFNYGGKRVYTYIGSSIQPKSGFLKSNRLCAEYGLPIYQDLNGIQMKTKNSFYLAWLITF